MSCGIAFINANRCVSKPVQSREGFFDLERRLVLTQFEQVVISFLTCSLSDVKQSAQAGSQPVTMDARPQ